MTEEQLKKRAEEYAKKIEKELLEDYEPIEYGTTPYLATIPTPYNKQAFIDGYHECQKEHEWHYVKDKLPIGKPYQNGTKAFVTVAYINNHNFPKKLDCYYWDNEFLCDSTYGYKKVEDVYGKVYAWKYEDKLPELPEEIK